MRLDEELSPAEQADLDRLELELRKLAEVVAVGFEGATVGSPVTDDDVLTVHVLIADTAQRAAVEQQAIDLGRLHLGRPLRIVVAPEGDERGGASEVSSGAGSAPRPVTRVRVIAVALADEGRSTDVTLAHGDTFGVGRGASGSPGGASAATIAALRQLGWGVPFEVASAVRLAVGSSGAVLVHLLGPDGERLGVSGGETAEHAAVKATLQALNRWLDDPARRPVTFRAPAE